jgi:hypothetical protein
MTSVLLLAPVWHGLQPERLAAGASLQCKPGYGREFHLQVLTASVTAGLLVRSITYGRALWQATSISPSGCLSSIRATQAKRSAASRKSSMTSPAGISRNIAERNSGVRSPDKSEDQEVPAGERHRGDRRDRRTHLEGAPRDVAANRRGRLAGPVLLVLEGVLEGFGPRSRKVVGPSPTSGSKTHVRRHAWRAQAWRVRVVDPRWR